jgi:uncharacterized protein (TIGR04141 family)
MPNQKPIKSLTILLLKAGVSEEETLDEDASKLQSYPVSVGGKTIGSLIAKQAPINPPAWLKLFAGSIDPMPKLRSGSVSAVFLIRSAGRVFALVFGQGRHLLRPGICEERFGLRVTLNSVDPDELRAVDVSTLESNPFHAKRQASRAAPLGEFGLDLDQDILRAVTGKPKDPERGTQMTGIDSLSVRVRVDLGSLKSLLKRYLDISELKDYQELFPWVDHVSEVRDPAAKDALFEQLIEVLKGTSPENVWAAIPELIDWTTFDSFRIGSTTSEISTDDVTLDRLLEALGDSEPTLELLRKKRVYCMEEGNPHPKQAWPFLQCLTAELSGNGGVHMLNGGTWYRVSNDFVSQVDADISTLVPSSIPMPNWGDEREDAYNKRIAFKSAGKWALMDCVMIKHSGMASPIEFCDLYTDDRRLVHVKRYGQSSILSHLFMQGVVSAHCLLSDPQFRHALNLKLPASHAIQLPQDRPAPDQYEIAFAIGSTETGSLRLPFFSRVTLKNVARTIQQSFGYRLTLNKIRINKLEDISN